LNAKIEVNASGSSSCQGNNCMGTGSASVKSSCAASPVPGSGGEWGALGAALAIVVSAVRRRRNKR
jgi:MYXO-CTERM domain-containing protein